MKRFIYPIGSLIILMMIITNSSCEEFVEVDEHFGQILYEEVFENEETATTAITTLYAKLRDEGILNGGYSSLSIVNSLYTDELEYYGNAGTALYEVYNHFVLPSNSNLYSFWLRTYHLIYLTNSAIAGLESSNSLLPETKNQLMGEALFVRAFLHFYLTNQFGDIPYIKTTNYEINSEVSRMPISEVYNLILEDLNLSKSLIGISYSSELRTRPNKLVVSAFLARVHLYMGNWEQAKTESSILISNSSNITIESDIQNEFLKESNSTIWHLSPKSAGENTEDARIFILNSTPSTVSLSSDFVNSMENNDLRRTHWVGEFNDGTTTWYYPHKYKFNMNTGSSMEYTVIFRLSEQYLIRAEALARLGNISDAIEDLNVVRNRAGLPNIEAQSIDELLISISSERRFELFTEHGHRWFDIKRFGIQFEVLEPLKPGWRSTNILFPIPESELLMNPNLNPQNLGY